MSRAWGKKNNRGLPQNTSDLDAKATPSLITLGEVLIDLIATEAGLDLEQVTGFHRQAGGAPANVAVAASRLGVPTRFVGKVGLDPFGRHLKHVLDANAVETKHLGFSKAARTTLAFVTWEDDGMTEFLLYGNPGASELLSEEDITEEIFVDARAFHFGSVSLAWSPSSKATLKALRMARDRNLLITFDPNVRESCWESSAICMSRVTSVVPDCQIVKLNEKEALSLTGSSEVGAAAVSLTQLGPQLVVITADSDGCYYKSGKYCGWVDSFDVKSEDPTGAGDAFMGGILAFAIRQEIDDLSKLSQVEIERMLRYASAVAALAITRTGAMSALPDHETVERFLCSRT